MKERTSSLENEIQSLNTRLEEKSKASKSKSCGFFSVLYCCPFLSRGMSRIKLFLLFLYLVSELSASLEESQDELQVLKRKNTAHIKVA